jgi:NitT/TauT family transport system substrate-binding protein
LSAFKNRRRTVRTLAVPLVLALALMACGNDGGNGDGDAVGDDEPTDTDTDDDAGDDNGAAAADPVELEMVVFQPPSLGAFLPAVIEAEEFDLAHGIDLQFVERPPDAYNSEFTSGQFQLGGSASLMSEGQRAAQGVDIAYLFNVHDYWAAVVSTDEEVTELTDLAGRDLAAVTGSTSYAMFQWFAMQQGLDLGEVTVENVGTPQLGTQAQTGRSTAVQIWEPGYSQLMAQVEGLVDIDLDLDAWEEEYGFSDIPYLGVAAHREWIEENEDLIPDLQAIYEDAAEWALANPEEAAEIIVDTLPEGSDVEPIAELLADNDRLGLQVYSAAEQEEAIRAVFDAGLEIDYFDTEPPEEIIYGVGE